MYCLGETQVPKIQKWFFTAEREVVHPFLNYHSEITKSDDKIRNPVFCFFNGYTGIRHFLRKLWKTVLEAPLTTS